MSISLNSGFACEIASLNFDSFDKNRKETRQKSVNIEEKYDSNTKTTLESKNKWKFY